MIAVILDALAVIVVFAMLVVWIAHILGMWMSLFKRDE